MPEEPKTSSKHKSPPYPSMSLQEALAHAKVFYESQRRNAVHMDVAVTTLGYKPNGSSGIRAVAALIAFGLAVGEGASGGRKIRVTELTFKLLMLKEEDPDRLALLKEAVMKPPIYAEMLSHWSDGLPSDDAISKHLIIDRHFNPQAVKELIRDFRKSYEFARLGESATISGVGSDTHEKQAEVAIPGAETTPQGMQMNTPQYASPAPQGPLVVGIGSYPALQPMQGMESLPILIGPGKQFILQYPIGTTQQDVDDFDEVWSIYKKRLIRQQEARLKADDAQED
jgi:hypothetical protein